jgi:hypothetical protein
MWDGDVTSLPEVGVVFPPLIHRFFHFFPLSWFLLVWLPLHPVLSRLSFVILFGYTPIHYTYPLRFVRFVCWLSCCFGVSGLGYFFSPCTTYKPLAFFCCLELRLEYRSGGDGGGCDDSDGTMGMVMMMGSVFNMAWAWLVVRRGQ